MSSMSLTKRLSLAGLALAATVGALVWGRGVLPAETAAEDGTPEVIATVSLGSRDEVSLTDDVAVDAERNRIYVVSNEYDGEKVFIVDGSTNTVADTIVVGEHIYGVGVNPTIDRIYLSISSTSGGTLAGVQVIDGATKTVLEHIEGIWGHVAVDPVANRVFTHDTSGHKDLLATIDGATHEVSTVLVGSSQYIENFIPEVNPQTGLVYVTYGGDNMVTVVDPSAGAVVTKIDIGAWPGRPAINPQTNRIYLQNLVDNEVVVVDGSSHSVAARISGTGEHMAVNPATNRLYRSKGGEIDVIDGTTNSVVSTFSWSDAEWGSYVRGMAVNSQTNRLYIAASVQEDEVVVVVQDGEAAPSSSPTASPTPSPPAQGTMHNCPRSGKWAISAWEGADGTDVGQALANCGEGAVAAAYRIDPDTQAWSRYFDGRPEISNLATVDDGQGVLALGDGMSASSALGEEPLRAAADGMLGCPQPGKWAISVWNGADGTSTEQAMATCGEGAVSAVYSLDPETQAWSRWFAGRPEVSTLSTLDNMQGVLAFWAGGGVAPTPSPSATPAPTATPTATPAEETGYLPPPQEVGDISAGGNAVVTVVNDTPHTLTLEFEGPTSETLSIAQCDTCEEYSFVGPIFCPTDRPEGTATLPPGTYSVTARVDDPSVIPFVGEWTLEGDTEYGHCFYIVTSFG